MIGDVIRSQISMIGVGPMTLESMISCVRARSPSASEEEIKVAWQGEIEDGSLSFLRWHHGSGSAIYFLTREATAV